MDGTTATSLQNISQSAIVKNLGKVATSVTSLFSCGGTIPQAENVLLFYKKSGDWAPKPLHLPTGLSDGYAVAELLEACSTPSSGFHKKGMIDKEFGDALKLQVGQFYTSFDIIGTVILDQVARIMSATHLQPELHMLNVYARGGPFKSQANAPRSAEMFGSLMVSLPSQFTGGDLVTQHQGQEVTYNWSSAATKCQWAAFINEVEYELLPVTSGHCITLTYNLYQAKPMMSAAPILNVTHYPFYQEFKAALQHPHFMRDGGTLGYCCQHYSKNFSTDLAQSSSSLKGEDAVVYETARLLKLQVSLRPVSRGPGYFRDTYRGTWYIIPEFYEEKGICWESEHFHADDFHPYQNLKVENIELEEHRLEVMKEHFGDGVVTDDGITWCQRSGPQEQVLEQHDCEKGVGCKVYQLAALLIVIPEFTDQRGL